MYEFSLLLIGWLAIGLLIGIKEAFIDEQVDFSKKEFEEHYRKSNPQASNKEVEFCSWFADTYFRSRTNLITINTLGGFYSVYNYYKRG